MMEATVTEPTVNTVSAESESQKGKYFLIDPSLRGNGEISGLVFGNKDALIHPDVGIVERPTGEPGQYREQPHLIHLPEKGGPPRDFEVLSGIWVVSEALKRVFEQVDAKGFAFAACKFSPSDGTQGPNYYLCDVVRTLDALDEAASRVKVKLEHDYQTNQDVKVYSVLGGASLVFDAGVVADAHIFRQKSLGAPPVCDHVMFEALTAADLSGVRLRDVAEL